MLHPPIRQLVLFLLLPLSACIAPITPAYDYRTDFYLLEGRIVDIAGRSDVPRTAGSAAEVFGNSPLASYRLTIFGAPIVSLSYGFKFQ